MYDPNRIALVTGAARRIGRTLALDLAAQGWSIGLHCHRSVNDAEDLAAEARRLGVEALVLPADLGEPSELAQLIPRLQALLGAPTCLINNASVFLEDHAASLDLASWDAHIDVNLRAPVFLAKSFAEHLPAGLTGNIVNILDQRVLRPAPEFFSYAVSKAALWAATRMLAQAFAPRIRVNGIGPGPVLRSIHQTEDAFAAECRATLLGRAIDPKEIATAVRFILDAPSMTGQMIALDGGQHLA